MPFFSFVSFQFSTYIIQFTDKKKKPTLKVTSEREIQVINYDL